MAQHRKRSRVHPEMSSDTIRERLANFFEGKRCKSRSASDKAHASPRNSASASPDRSLCPSVIGRTRTPRP